MVRTPMTGRSMRRSWIGFGRFTSTPRRALRRAANGCNWQSSATRFGAWRRCLLAASTESTRPSADDDALARCRMRRWRAATLSGLRHIASCAAGVRRNSAPGAWRREKIVHDLLQHRRRGSRRFSCSLSTARRSASSPCGMCGEDGWQHGDARHRRVASVFTIRALNLADEHDGVARRLRGLRRMRAPIWPRPCVAQLGERIELRRRRMLEMRAMKYGRCVAGQVFGQHDGEFAAAGDNTELAPGRSSVARHAEIARGVGSRMKSTISINVRIGWRNRLQRNLRRALGMCLLQRTTSRYAARRSWICSRVKPLALETHDVEAAQVRVVADGGAERNEVGRH